MSHSRKWVDTSQPATSATDSRQVPSGEGEHFVVVAAGTANGFIEGSSLCYPAKSTSGDYHGEMTGELLIRWLTNQLLALLSEPSVMVLGKAPYHNQLIDACRCPTTSTKKADLTTWLERRRIPVPDGATRPELLLRCQQHRPKPQYTMDNIIREWGHEVVRLPPAHPELNAIDQVWACMKRHVCSSLHRFTRADLQARLEEAKLLVTHRVWASAVKRSRDFEDGYLSSDNIQEPVGHIIINKQR
ncbi:uncharacterized protein [Macrobrachium rosenbergii]|uniref:uncharacterized protein n=1 Tax=Macrobrachium rosenbergii TaxID=79674 RepID=UPI0034D4C4C2